MIKRVIIPTRDLRKITVRLKVTDNFPNINSQADHKVTARSNCYYSRCVI